MDHAAFCYWLQGFFEMTDSKNLSEAQVKMVKEHLKLVFTKVTPSGGGVLGGTGGGFFGIGGSTVVTCSAPEAKKSPQILKDSITSFGFTKEELEKKLQDLDKRWATNNDPDLICSSRLNIGNGRYC